ncbi:hypothetical protein BJ138DRAFT_1149672 [Hygrophoropsis aurantiaca]|uniref:Uncharacterized protein n=1 Tax=Hygrophoropsis aurantiaca TaxID=72124 RepID=A0ACB8AF18_9AGAM|nr:hypothetical protein BJ138DRAFT_1149672 [Hygrophoropsis aurantiaca]
MKMTQSQAIENPFLESAAGNRSFNILTTSCMLLEQLQSLEQVYDATQTRVEHKRAILLALQSECNELGIVISGEEREDPLEGWTEQDSPSLNIDDDTPLSRRTRLASPRLRGLYDLHGPGKLNLYDIQTSADFTPKSAFSDDSCHDEGTTGEDLDGEWIDEDIAENLPFIIHETESGDDHDVHTIRIITPPKDESTSSPPLNQNTFSATAKFTAHGEQHDHGLLTSEREWAPVLARKSSNRRHPSVRSAKTFQSAFSKKMKPSNRRTSAKLELSERTHTSARDKISPQIIVHPRANSIKKVKRRGLRSIYSVCSELGIVVRGKAQGTRLVQSENI